MEFDMTESSLDRFWDKVRKGDACWIWTASVRPNGYGTFWYEGRLHPAHRWIYGRLVEDLVRGSHIDHLCRNRACVRPSHLEQVTEVENILRGQGAPAQNARRTHCVNGHEFTVENTASPKRGGRRCRACDRAQSARQRISVS